MGPPIFSSKENLCHCLQSHDHLNLGNNWVFKGYCYFFLKLIFLTGLNNDLNNNCIRLSDYYKLRD